jgi:hypothetical protein
MAGTVPFAGNEAMTKTARKPTASAAAKRSTPRRAAAKNPPARSAKRAVPLQADPAPATTTIRLRPEVRRGLEFLHGKLGGTMNKLVNDGLAVYVQMRTASLDEELRSALDEIRKLRQSDPMFTKDFAEVARAETMHAADDPAQGVATRSSRRPKAGSAVSMVRSLIGSTR